MQTSNDENKGHKNESLDRLIARRNAAEKTRDEWRARKEQAAREGLTVAAEVAAEWELRAQVEVVDAERRIKKAKGRA